MTDTVVVHNSPKWIEDNGAHNSPGIKTMFSDQVNVLFIGGPNEPNWHAQEGEEVFFQIKGDIVLNTRQNGVQTDIPLKEGEILLLPSRVEHTTTRPADTIGLVLEQSQPSQVTPLGSAQIPAPINLQNQINASAEQLKSDPVQLFGLPDHNTIALLYGPGSHKINTGIGELVVVPQRGTATIVSAGNKHPVNAFDIGRVHHGQEVTLVVDENSVVATIKLVSDH